MFIIIYKFKYKLSIKSIDSFNNISYIVNDLPDAQNASDTLATIMISINKLINNIIEDNDQSTIIKTELDKKYIKYIKVIKDRLPYVRISENPVNSIYTSYSIKNYIMYNTV